MSLKPYPEYKASGVEFLGQIPSHWSLPPAVELARVLTSTVDKKSYEKEISVQLCNYTDVYYNDLIRSNVDYMRATASQEQIDAYSVRGGDVPFTKDSESADDIGIAAYVERDLPGVVYGYHLSTYRPHDAKYGKYLKWLLDSKYAKAIFEARTPGVTRVGLSRNTIRYLRVPTPPSEEAALIAGYLDRETAEIDAFIADQEELITLLTERRTATISHAVTKGLDPSAPMKDSGVEWLGQIPAHWDVAALSRFVSFGNGADYKDIEVAEGGYPVYGSGGIFRKASSFIYDGESVLFGRKGTIDRPVHVTGKFWTVDTMYYTKINLGQLAPRYLYYWATQLPFGYWVTSTALPSMTQTDLGSARIPVLPVGEQEAVFSYLDLETAEIDATIADAHEVIELSKERRAALISAAVTGKIDVRNHRGVD